MEVGVVKWFNNAKDTERALAHTHRLTEKIKGLR